MKRLVLTRTAFVVALGLCSLSLTSPAGGDDVGRLIDEALALSGLAKQLDMLTGTMVAAVPDEAFSSEKARKEVDRFVDKAASEKALASKIRDTIRLDFDRDALNKVVDFYQSRVGRKVGRLQGKALIPSSIQDVREGRNIVTSLSESRTATIKRIIGAQQVYQANFQLLDQMVNGLADGFLSRGHADAERIRDRLKNLVEKARSADEHTGRLAMVAYARTLRDLDDKELEDFAKFNESEPAEWFRNRVQRGLEEAVYMSAKALGQAITKSERPATSTTTGDR